MKKKKRNITLFVSGLALAAGFFFLALSPLQTRAAEIPDASAHNHPACGTVCPGGTGHEGHEAVTWTAWDKTDCLPDSENQKYYYLTKDITLSNSSIFLDYSLCLNGHTITGTDGKVIPVSYWSSVLTDCSTEPHKFSVDPETGLWTPDENGTETLTGGYLSNIKLTSRESQIQAEMYNLNLLGSSFMNSDDALLSLVQNVYPNEHMTKTSVLKLQNCRLLGSRGPGIFVKASILDLYDCTVAGNQSYGISIQNGDIYANGGYLPHVPGEVRLHDGTEISGNRDTGIRVYESTLRIEGGKIADNYGYGVLATNYYDDTPTKVYMSGGEISGNRRDDHNNGGGVELFDNSKATFEMTGGEIKNNAGQQAGGVNIGSTCSFFMSGGKICGNEGYSGNMSAGGIHHGYSDHEGTLRITGGEISGNHTDTYNGVAGIYSYEMELGGSVVIRDNTNKSGRPDNLLIVDPIDVPQIKIVSPFTEDAYIEVSSKGIDKMIQFTDAAPADYSSYFHSDDEAYSIFCGAQNALMIAPLTKADLAAINDTIQKIDAIGTGYILYNDTYRQKIKDARSAYNAIGYKARRFFPAEKLALLKDAEKVYDVLTKFYAVGKVENTAACGQKIKDARTAYDALTDAQKQRISGTDRMTFEAAEAEYEKLSAAGGSGGNSGNSSGGNGDGSSGGSGTDAPADSSSKQIRTIRKELGVSEKTAKKILSMAEKQKVPMDTILVTDKKITSQKTHKDIKGSSFAAIQAQAAKAEKTSIRLAWNKVKNADGYIIYGAKCKNGTKFKTLKTVKKGTTSFTHKKLSKGTYYRYIVRAYKLVDGKKVTIAASKTICETTGGGKRGNIKSLKLNRTSLSLKKGKTFTLKATEKKESKPISRHRKVSYESGNPSVASVTAKGVVKAKKKGKCTIYVYAQNGVYKKITVNVK